MDIADCKNPKIVERWREVLQHSVVVADAEWDEVDEGFVTLHLADADADTWGIYPALSISPEGSIAEYNVNQPYHYPTFADLLAAAAVRTTIS